MASCSKPIGKGVLNFLCDLPQNHLGPCATRDKPRVSATGSVGSRGPRLVPPSVASRAHRRPAPSD